MLKLFKCYIMLYDDVGLSTITTVTKLKGFLVKKNVVRAGIRGGSQRFYSVHIY